MSHYLDLSGSAISQLAETLKHRVEAVANDLTNEIKAQMENAAPRTGHEYPMPDTPGAKYTASAPGEPPAVRLGNYLGAWQTSPAVVVGDTVRAAAVNDRKTEDEEHFVGELLEYGTNDILTYGVKMFPRPHIRPALEIVAQRWGGVVKKVGE